MNIYNNLFPDCGTHNDLLAFFIQVITIIPYGIAFWRDNKKYVLMWVSISCVLFTIGYFLLSAYSGIVIAIGTFISTVIGEIFAKMQNISFQIRILAFTIMVAVTILISLLLEQNSTMWLILIAGFFDYYAYIVFDEYNKAMHVILILSQFTLVVYEIFFKLYIFAMLDLITLLVITIHMLKVARKEK